ncbi:MAG TPA: M90 family metallopeptidase [Candidatus Elarobacter sp.]|nr:M90 family metallopeptidase [Candidatus Elarobacter sp.]
MFHHRKGLVADWEQIAAAELTAWDVFSPDEHEELAAAADWLLRHKHWEAAHGFELDDEIVTTLSLLAAIPVLALDVDHYREVSAIIVYPTTIASHGTYAGPVRGTVTDGVIPVLGQAHERRGPVLLAWDDARHAAHHPGRGRNVVFHEFAHKLDMLDDLSDGTPPLEFPEQRARWVEVCTAAYDALRAGHDVVPLDPYGAVSVAEFFAVATEAFFDAPVKLAEHQPDLYEVLRGFYKQDPATRARRAVG